MGEGRKGIKLFSITEGEIDSWEGNHWRWTDSVKINLLRLVTSWNVWLANDTKHERQREWRMFNARLQDIAASWTTRGCSTSCSFPWFTIQIFSSSSLSLSRLAENVAANFWWNLKAVSKSKIHCDLKLNTHLQVSLVVLERNFGIVST